MAANRRTDQDRIDPNGQIPEADLLDQQAPLDPRLIDDDHSPVDPVGTEASVEPADEADRWEQQLPVPSDGEEYPHADPDNGLEAG